MGGYGSGRWGGRPALEDGLSFGLADIIRKGIVRPYGYTAGTATWSGGQPDEKSPCVGFEADLLDPARSWLRLHYTITTLRDGSKINCDYKVRLVTSRPPFGGLRWWFICPLTGRRVTKLHLPTGGVKFGSRQAYRLAYRSQRLNGCGRTHAWQARVCRKLGVPYKMALDYAPPRPKWMRHKTYARLQAEAEAAIEAHDTVFVMGAAKLLTRMGLKWMP